MTKTLITPSKVLSLAFSAEDQLPPDTITEGDIMVAEERYIVPIVGRRLYGMLLLGRYPELITEHLAAPLARYTRLVATDRMAYGFPHSSAGRSAEDEERTERLKHSLRTEGTALLRRMTHFLGLHRADYPEYNPYDNPLTHCTLDGNMVTIF